MMRAGMPTGQDRRQRRLCLTWDVPPCQKTGMARSQHLIPLETIERRIYVIRDHNVMLDFDLAGACTA
jgi:hypothetical protein